MRDLVATITGEDTSDAEVVVRVRWAANREALVERLEDELDRRSVVER